MTESTVHLSAQTEEVLSCLNKSRDSTHEDTFNKPINNDSECCNIWNKNVTNQKSHLPLLSDTDVQGSMTFINKINFTEQKKTNYGLSNQSLNFFDISKRTFFSLPEITEKVDSFKNHYIQLLDHEINHLREKFEINNKVYQLDDLIRLTDNSKRILHLQTTHKNSECDEIMSANECVYQNIEYRKMNLEKKIGVCDFFKAYRKMVNIINDDFDFGLKNLLECSQEAEKKYSVPNMIVSGDSDDVIKNVWKSIINTLGDKQEYLPDIWELAMSENIYYHL